MTLNIAALASGRGSNIASMLKAVASGKLDAKFVLILSNNPQAPVLEIAEKHSIPVFARSHKDFANREAFDAELIKAIQNSGADTVVLAGYMRMLTPLFVRAFAGRIVNIHPAILPSFAGAHGGRDALNYGVRFTGATVHFVDEVMDNGPVIIQAVVPVGCEDTEESLMPRIHALEHRIFPQALQWLADGRLRLEGRRIILAKKDGETQPLASASTQPSDLWLVAPPLEDF